MKTRHALAALVSLLALNAARLPAADLRETYVNGLKNISDTKAACERTGSLLAIVETSAGQQSQAVAGMESRLLRVRQTLTDLQNNTQGMTAAGASLLARRDLIQNRFATLQTALADTRALLDGATKSVDALVASADKSGVVAERQLASQTSGEFQRLASQLQRRAMSAGQTSRQIDLEYTLFKGLQDRPAIAASDITAALGELKATTDQVAKQRASVDALLARLAKDRASLTDKYNAFSQTVENFRVAQTSVLRRWLLDGPPAGEIPSLTIDDVLENSYSSDGTVTGGMLTGGQFYDMSGDRAKMATAPAPAAAYTGRAAQSQTRVQPNVDMTQISPETIQNYKRAQWYLAMLRRLDSFADESQSEADSWLSDTSDWRGQLGDITSTLAQQRGTLSTLQLEQDTMATTVTLIGKQADTTGTEVATTADYIATQTTALQSIIDDIQKRSAEGQAPAR